MSLYPEDVPFEVVREDWCTYDLGNGCILKTKLVLAKILKPPRVPLENIQELQFQTRPHFVVYAPLEKKGTPETRPLTPELLRKSIIEDVDPKPIKTSANEYSLEGGRAFIRLTLMLTRVALTDKFTDDGSPVYVISHQVVPQIRLPKRKRSSSQKDSKAVV